MLVGLACSSPEKQAQKLFDEGKYEEVLMNFGDRPIAVLARQKIAERLLAEQRYNEVIKQYPDTPSATQAIEILADSLLAAGKYDELLQRFPNANAAASARKIMEEAKVKADNREVAARAALNKAKTHNIYGFKGDGSRIHRGKLIAKKMELDRVAKTYAGTSAAEEAKQLAREVQEQINHTPLY